MKRLIFSILICVFAWGVKAQEIDALFVSMPDKNIPQLEDAWRKDLVDLYKSGKEARLKNTMNGFSTLKNLTSDYLLLQVTDRSTIEMKLLPLVNNTNVICLVKTVNGPVPDSRIEFLQQNGNLWQLPTCSLPSRRIGSSKKMQIKTVRLFWMLFPVWIWI